MAINSSLREAMNRLVGTWRTEGRMLDGDGDTWSGHDIYEWFPGGQHMVHRVDVEIFGARKESMEFLTPREGSVDTIDQVSFDAAGTVETSVGHFDMEGRYLIDAGGARAVLSFDGPDAMGAHWQYRAADGTWIDWMRVSFTRIAAPHIEVRSKPGHAD
ncbi:hypothetical protein EAH68_08400 [Corynebacterium hylobatis]|uniref:DUF1579 domain-containing protein n=1 Tax=Corynebacterium hylobatis TaxID=1859290 RepID=A0A3R9ZZH6_9CORY|nr:hypothetical protein [Corynebacterium hylobatis]RSZ63190.1 hypothetical protein EAH68_08400 [Corynebacterium hylobatis]